MKELIMIYEDVKLTYPYHSSMVVLVKALRKAKRLKIEITPKILDKVFMKLVEKDDYNKDDVEEIRNFLLGLLYKNSAEKPL